MGTRGARAPLRMWRALPTRAFLGPASHLPRRVPLTKGLQERVREVDKRAMAQAPEGTPESVGRCPRRCRLAAITWPFGSSAKASANPASQFHRKGRAPPALIAFGPKSLRAPFRRTTARRPRLASIATAYARATSRWRAAAALANTLKTCAPASRPVPAPGRAAQAAGGTT